MLQLATKFMANPGACSRRGFLTAMLSSGSALALPNLLRHRAQAAAAGKVPRDTAVIQVWLGGGPSHLDMYDMKPDAPDGFRGPFRPMRTSLPGLDICELLPRQARVIDRLSLVRSLHHDHNGAHVPAIHCMQTGHLVQKFVPTRPSAGAITARARGSNRPGMPAYAQIGTDPKHLVEAPPNFGSAYLGPQYAPFPIKSAASDPPWGDVVRFETPNLTLAMDLAQLQGRARMLKQLDRLSRALDPARFEALDDYHRQALQLLTSPQARAAFDLSQEDPRLRDKYGMNAWGQGALLCRRLVEAGVTYITLNTDSSSITWDHHEKLQSRCEAILPVYDQMLAALVEDLADRGLFERVLLLVWGEFSRTPKINANGGRDHWGNACSALLAGGGVKGGRIIGATTSRGDVPRERPVKPCDVLATVYRVLGIDPRREFHDVSGRPLPVLDAGEAIAELF
jgi:uncharacterized protein (DUF1501 family)